MPRGDEKEREIKKGRGAYTVSKRERERDNRRDRL